MNHSSFLLFIQTSYFKINRMMMMMMMSICQLGSQINREQWCNNCCRVSYHPRGCQSVRPGGTPSPSWSPWEGSPSPRPEPAPTVDPAVDISTRYQQPSTGRWTEDTKTTFKISHGFNFINGIWCTVYAVNKSLSTSIYQWLIAHTLFYE